jgi:hypothetical protein
MAWSTYLTDAGGRPALALLDRRFEVEPPTGQLPRLAWFGVWFRLPPGGGLWDPAEDEALEAIERALIELAGQHSRGWAVYVRSLSTPGIREYYLYAGGHVDFAPVLSQLKARFPDYRLEYEHREDPDWGLYRQWLVEPGQPVA